MELLFGPLLQKHILAGQLDHSHCTSEILLLQLAILQQRVFSWSLFSMDFKTISILLDSDDTGKQLLLAVHKGPRRSQRKKTGSDCETLEAFLGGKIAFASLSTGYRKSVIKHHSILASQYRCAFTCDWCRPSRFKEPTRLSTLLKLAVRLIGLL